MPPKAPPRTVLAEVSLARRIANERESRKWSPSGLAARMTQAGCPMKQSAIWKIENGDPPRRITFDEAVTFARVFEVSLEELAAPQDVVAAHKAAGAATAISWKVESLLELLTNEIRPNLQDLLQVTADAEHDELLWGALALIARGEAPEPWSDRHELIRRAHEEQESEYEAAVVEEWLGSVGRRLRQVAVEAEDLAGVFAFYADGRLRPSAQAAEEPDNG